MRDNKHDKIVEAAREIIGNEGFKAASLQKIADKVGIHKSTLFHYLRNKKELLVYILEGSTSIASTRLEKILYAKDLEPEEKMKAFFTNHLQSVVQDISGLNIYLNQLEILPAKYRKIYKEKRKDYEKYFEKIVIQMQEKGYFESMDTKIVSFGILGMLNSVPRWFKEDGPLTLEEVSDNLFRLIVKQ